MFPHSAVVRWDSLIQQFKGLCSCPYYRCCWRGRRGCRGTRHGGGGRNWQICWGVGGGQAGLELQIILEIASCSVCNQDQTGSGWGEEEVTVDFCQASFCLCVSRLSGMTFARATVEMSHHLILSSIIHPPARALCRSVAIAPLAF